MSRASEIWFDSLAAQATRAIRSNKAIITLSISYASIKMKQQESTVDAKMLEADVQIKNVQKKLSR